MKWGGFGVRGKETMTCQPRVSAKQLAEREIEREREGGFYLKWHKKKEERNPENKVQESERSQIHDTLSGGGGMWPAAWC